MVRRHMNPLMMVAALGVFLIILWFAFALYADAANDVFPEQVLSQVDRSLDMSLIGQLPDHFKGKVVEIQGDVVSAEKDGRGIVVTIRIPGSKVVEEVQNPDEDASPWTALQNSGLRKVVRSATEVCRVRISGQANIAAQANTDLFPVDSTLRLIGTVRNITLASIDEQGIAHSHMVDLVTSCFHIQPWDDTTGKPGEAATVCEPVTK